MALSVVRRLMSSIAVQSASGVAWTGVPIRKPPAMLHSTSIPAKRSTAAATAASTCAASSRSAAANIRCAVSLPNTRSRLARRPTSTTLSPSSAKRCATAWPRWPAAPVTSTVRGPECASVVIAALSMMAAGAARHHHVVGEHVAGIELRQVAHALVERREVDAGQIEQCVEAVDDEVRLLEVVDAITRSHDAHEVEPDAVRRIVLQREAGLAVRRHDAGTVDAQLAALPDQSELDREPVHARELLE